LAGRKNLWINFAIHANIKICNYELQFMKSKASLLASLCWINPFSRERMQLESLLLEKSPLVETPSGATVISWSVGALVELCQKTVAEEPGGAEYSEIAAFIIYHELASDLDQMLEGKVDTATVWRRYRDLWNRYFRKPNVKPRSFDETTLFALFYQIRRAFHWIYRYVIGSSEEANNLRFRIWESIFSRDLKRYVDGFHREMSDVHTLITGPSGSGKGIVARAIGMSRYIPFDTRQLEFICDPRESFLTVNVAALPEQLLEAELFGHAKGAFTGATRARAGFFESAGEYGALFLDEIGETGESAQAKLLTVLQERRFQRVGETTSRRAQGRVITATNRNLEEAVSSGKFREDLYFRLSADRLEMVGLKDLIGGNVGALKPMVEYITGNLLREAWTRDVVADSLQFIEERLGPNYDWPGNFRELEQCLRNFLIHGNYQPVRFGKQADGQMDDFLGQVELGAEELLSRYAKALYGKLGTYKKVGAVMGVDQRTAKKYVDAGPQA
jgi:hypothetical protein